MVSEKLCVLSLGTVLFVALLGCSQSHKKGGDEPDIEASEDALSGDAGFDGYLDGRGSDLSGKEIGSDSSHPSDVSELTDWKDVTDPWDFLDAMDGTDGADLSDTQGPSMPAFMGWFCGAGGESQSDLYELRYVFSPYTPAVMTVSENGQFRMQSAVGVVMGNQGNEQ